MNAPFFFDERAALNALLELDSTEATHITKALRMRSGDAILLTNGCGELFKAELTIDKHHVKAQVVEVLPIQDSAVAVHLGIAPTKNADRIEWLVEKAVEIGIGSITLLACEHSERSKMSVDRLRRVAIAALKQSQRTVLPAIHDVRNFRQWVEECNADQRFIAHCHSGEERMLLRDALNAGLSTALAIGPEGDFSQAEVAFAQTAQFKSVSLGDARLRTETAALAGIHTFCLINQ